MAGLDVGIVVRDAADLDTIAERAETVGIPANRSNDVLVLRDPWGTQITLTQ